MTLTCLLLCVLTAIPMRALELGARTLADLSIEELMNESVKSVSQKEQKLSDVATAISVLSNDDLRRTGARSIAEALRLVPGLVASSVNAGEWAISARGFHTLYSNKLLVLVDGRAVYTPFFAGVYWDLQQTMLDDVDRIEVIRGPGATVWGANAVNGVVNVATRSARNTQGGLLYGGGNAREATTGVRYGGQLGANTYYRAFASYQSTDDRFGTNGQSAHDGWVGLHGGMRIDSYALSDTHLTWQADATSARLDNDTSYAANINTLGRWTRQLSAASSVEAQAYFDRTHRDESARARTTVNTADFSLHHIFSLGERNDFIWGLGYRHMDNRVEQTTPAAQIRDQDFSLQLFSAFAQDEIKLVPHKLNLTVGTKLEHNDFTGFEVQPSIRTVFKPDRSQSFWGAISRAVRTPNVIEGGDAVAVSYGAPLSGPGGMLLVPTLVGNTALSSEVQWAYEVGYRTQLSRRVSVDFTAYYNAYRNLIGTGDVQRVVPGVPVGIAEIPWMNNISGNTRGTEAAINVSPGHMWRLTASYARFVGRFRGPSSTNPVGAEENTPSHQAMLRSSSDLTRRTSLDAQIRYIHHVPGVAAHYSADLRFAYRLTDHMELSVTGRNLLDRRHAEHPSTAFGVISEVPRVVTGRLSWRF